VVTLDKRGYGLLGSCTWWTRQVGENVLHDLYHAKAALGAKAAHARLAIFSRAGVTERLRARAAHEDVVLINVDDLF